MNDNEEKTTNTIAGDFKATVSINQKDYLACNLYYLRKFIGIREIVLMLILIGAAVGIYILTQKYIFLIMFGVVAVMVVSALLIYYFASVKGYKYEFEKRGATHWDFVFDEEKMHVEVFEADDKHYPDVCTYEKIEKVALLKDRAYFFLGSAMCYYIRYSDMTEGDFVSFCEFIKKKVTPDKFKMKYKRKVTINPVTGEMKTPKK